MTATTPAPTAARARTRSAARRAALLVLLPAMPLLAGAACDDPSEPLGLAGSYVLESVAGEPLPAILTENDFTRFLVHADELRLNPDGTGARITAGVTQHLDGETEPEPAEWESPVLFRVVGPRVSIEYICPINASCVGPPHLIATRVPSGLRVESALGERGPLLYVRPEDAAGG